jgi:hypothetical protein
MLMNDGADDRGPRKFDFLDVVIGLSLYVYWTSALFSSLYFFPSHTFIASLAAGYFGWTRSGIRGALTYSLICSMVFPVFWPPDLEKLLHFSLVVVAGYLGWSGSGHRRWLLYAIIAFLVVAALVLLGNLWMWKEIR